MAVGEQTKSKGGIQSLSRAVEILEVVAHNRNGIGLADICKTVGLHNSTAHHLAQTLVSEGMLRQDVTTKMYRIGARLFGLASSSIDEIEIHDAARPILSHLATVTGENTHVAVWSGDDVVIIGRTEGTSSVRVAERVGVLRPAYATAIGKCLLSGLGDHDLETYFQNVEMAPITKLTVTSQKTLKQQLNNIRAHTLAEDNGEMDLEIRCFAAQVRDFSGEVIASIGISAPIWRLDKKDIAVVGSEILTAAHMLSTALGYRN